MPSLQPNRQGLIEVALQEYPDEFVIFFGDRVLAHGRKAQDTHNRAFEILCARYRGNESVLRRLARFHLLMVTPSGDAWPREKAPRVCLLPERLRPRRRAELIRFPSTDTPRFPAKRERETGHIRPTALRRAG